jgi:hypothetical protein
MTDETMVRPGDRVVFMSGRQLGEVDLSTDRTLRVRTGVGPIWLTMDAVFTRNGSRVTLACEEGGLADYAPGARPQPRHGGARPQRTCDHTRVIRPPCGALRWWVDVPVYKDLGDGAL